MQIGFLGSGAWGMVLANLAASNGHKVTVWSIEQDVIKSLQEGKGHPKFPDLVLSENLSYTTSLKEAITDKDLLCESVTTKGIRPVLEKILEVGPLKTPLVMTSKGIEQGTGFLLPEIARDVLGEGFEDKIGCLSGPTIADEVRLGHPTSAVAASTSQEVIELIVKTFSNPLFRVYRNQDIIGVSLGGALKNVLAIASGICQGLGYGYNTKSALIARGLHEMLRLVPCKGAKPETLRGLSGIGDLCVTCMSPQSRNYRFGVMIGQGLSVKEAKEKINMVVEGENTVVSAYELGKKAGVELPITNALYSVLQEGKEVNLALKELLNRDIKDEHL